MKILKWLWLPLVIVLLFTFSLLILQSDSWVSYVYGLRFLEFLGGEIDYKLEDIKQKITPLNDPVLHVGLAEKMRDMDEVIKEYQKAIELDPKNPLPHIGIILTYFDEWKRAEKKEIPPQLLSAIDEGIKVEPQNAFYHYIRGYLYISQGTERSREIAWEKIDILIKDRKLVEKGLNEIILGNKKNYYDAYNNERGKAIVSVLERTGRKLNPIRKIGEITAVVLPDLLTGIRVAKTLVVLSKQYEDEGNQTKALISLEAIPPMGKKMAQRSHWLISLLVAISIQDRGEEALKDYYTQRGMAEQASYYETRITQRKQLQQEAKKSPKGWDKAKLGMLDSLMMPIGGKGTNIDYDPAIGRRMDYAFIEYVFLSGLFIGMLFLILVALIGWFYTRRRIKKYHSSPLEIHWRIKDLVIIYLGGLILPIFFYLLYDRLHYIREYGLPHLSGLILYQVISLVLLSLVLLLVLTAQRLRRKLTQPLSDSNLSTAIRLKRYSLLVLLGFATMLSYFWIGTNWRNDFYGWLLIISGVIAIVLSITGWVISLRRAKARSKLPLVYQHRILYFKSLIPILGGGLIILMLIHLTIVRSYLRRSVKVYEHVLIDRIIEDEVGMTKWKALRELKD